MGTKGEEYSPERQKEGVREQSWVYVESGHGLTRGRWKECTESTLPTLGSPANASYAGDCPLPAAFLLDHVPLGAPGRYEGSGGGKKERGKLAKG